MAYTTADACIPTSSGFTTTTEWDFRVDDITAAGYIAFYGSTSGANSVSLQVAQTTGVGTISVRPDSGSAQNTVIPNLAVVSDNWYHVELFLTCTEDGVGSADPISTTIVVTDLTTDTPYGVDGPSPEINAASANWETFEFSANGLDWIDNFGFSEPQPTTTAIFCATTDEDSDFGYDFREGVTFEDETVGPGIDIEEGYEFSGDETNFDYLAKSWGGTVATPTTGATELALFFRIEAMTDNEESVFRAAFSTHRATGTPSAPVMDKGTGAGNAGINDGDFDDHIEIQMREDGNLWEARFFYVSGGVPSGPGERTQAGPTSYFPLPNTATTYKFEVRDGNLILERLTSTPDQDEIGELSSFSTPIPAPFTSSTYYQYWFIGYGVQDGINADTRLDDPVGESDMLQGSTCVYDLNGLVESSNGDIGSVAPDFCDIDTPVDTENPPDSGEGLFDISEAEKTLFMAFLLVFGIVWMGVQRGLVGGGLTALFAIGLGIAYAIGWLPLWVILVIFTASLATIFLIGPRSQGSGV